MSKLTSNRNSLRHSEEGDADDRSRLIAGAADIVGHDGFTVRVGKFNRERDVQMQLRGLHGDGMILRDHDLSQIGDYTRLPSSRRALIPGHKYRLKAQLVKTEIHSTHNISPPRTKRRKSSK